MFSSPFTAVYWAVIAMVPVFLRKPEGFAGSELETVIITSAIPVMSLACIFWNEAYLRIRNSRYILIVWILAFVPLGGIALCHSPEMVVFCMVLSAFGMSGTPPLAGDIMRNCYPESRRGSVYSILSAAGQVSVIAVTFLIGQWLDADREAFRVYMPISVIILGVGMFLTYMITREPEFQQRKKPKPTERLRTSLLNAYRNMMTVLGQDRSFRRYEIAFFIYGTGWMVCMALLPLLVVDKLKLDYDEVANATQVTLFAVLLIAMVPAGYLLDKIGPIKLASLGFACMAIYAIGLILATNMITLTIAVVFSGLGMTGVHLAWMIGPVALARHASQAAHYIAIHATLVGARAIVGQFPAVMFYKYTGNIQIPLGAAILCILTGTILMRRLARDTDLTQKPVPVPIDAMSDMEHEVIP
ncbi:MAG: MFS transporter [Planctomycetota bacterium]